MDKDRLIGVAKQLVGSAKQAAGSSLAMPSCRSTAKASNSQAKYRMPPAA
jgi:hypothetical protein